MYTTSSTSMDTIKLEKLQAMKKYRRIQLFQNVFQYCLTFMVVILCLSKSVWFMSLCSAVKGFFLFTLPRVGAHVMTPKCLFIVCNVIVVILVGESKTVGSAPSSSTSDLYDEYVRRIRSQSLKSVPAVQHQVGQQKLLEYSTSSRESQLKIEEENDEEDEHEDEEKEEDAEEEDPQDQKEDQEEEEEREEEEEEEASEQEEEVKLEAVHESNSGEEDDNDLLTEELNRRVEDFIAKVNRQRRIEADMLLCSG